MFGELTEIARRPRPFDRYTAPQLWTDPHISGKMLEFHLDPEAGLASRPQRFIEESVRWIASRFDIGPGVRVCDFGCGPGLYTSAFAKLGARVTGIDFSERSIEHARGAAAREGLDIEYILGDYLEFSTDERFDLITLIFCDYCPLSPDQRRTLLGVFDGCLAEGGAILLDVVSLVHFDLAEERTTLERSEDGGFWSAAPHFVFRNTFKYAGEALVLDKYTVVEAARTFEILNWIQCFSPESLKREFGERGFEVVERYSDVAGDVYDPEAAEFAVVARRTGKGRP